MPVTKATTVSASLPVPSATRCRHCGDLCRASAVTTRDGTFCCSGCESVFELIATHGLSGFYRCAVSAGVSQQGTDGRHPLRFAALDDPEIARRFVRPGLRGVAQVTFVVPGLHCAACVWLLEQLWRFDPGIARSEVDLLRRTVTIQFLSDRISLRKVAERLASLGYEPLIDADRRSVDMPASRRSLYLKIGVAGFAFGNVMLFSIPRYLNGGPLEGGFQRLFDLLNLSFAIPVLLYSASDYFRATWAALRVRAMTLELPISIGLIALFLRSVIDIGLGRGEGFLDSFSGLVFFLLIGRLFQQRAFDRIAFDRTVRSFFPLSVRVEHGDALRLTPIEQLAPGEVMVLRPQEVVPAEAVLLDEGGAIDYAFVSGEQAPAGVTKGDAVRAGGRVVGRSLRLAVIRDVRRSQLVELWNHPIFAKPKRYWLAEVSGRFGWMFTIVAVGLALAGALAWWPDAWKAADVATAVLIIACPCALTLAAPITLGTAMGTLGRAGCYLKHAGVALDLSRVNTIALDKTGTLTTATSEAQVAFDGANETEQRLIQRLAAESTHPVSRAIVGRSAVDGSVAAVHEVAGQGLTGTVNGHHVVLGSAAFVAAETGRQLNAGDERTWGAIGQRDPVPLRLETAERTGIAATVQGLSARYDLWLLSGDHPGAAARWRPLFGEHARFRQSPPEKLDVVRDQQRAGRHVLMVGDGLNDAGALAAADVGMAVSDDTACLVPACDAVIRGDRLTVLPAILDYAGWSRRVIQLCLAVSLAYNAIGLSLALAGRLTPLASAILMPLSSLTIVGLSIGLMRLRTSALVPR